MHRERKEFEKLEQLRLNAEAAEKKRDADVQGSDQTISRQIYEAQSSDSIVLRRQGSSGKRKPALTRITSKHPNVFKRLDERLQGLRGIHAHSSGEDATNCRRLQAPTRVTSLIKMRVGESNNIERS